MTTSSCSALSPRAAPARRSPNRCSGRSRRAQRQRHRGAAFSPASRKCRPQVREQSAGQMIERLDRAGVRLQSYCEGVGPAPHRDGRSPWRTPAPPGHPRCRAETRSSAFRACWKPTATCSRPRAASSRTKSRTRCGFCRWRNAAREDAAPRLSAYLLLDAALRRRSRRTPRRTNEARCCAGLAGGATRLRDESGDVVGHLLGDQRRGRRRGCVGWRPEGSLQPRRSAGRSCGGCRYPSG